MKALIVEDDLTSRILLQRILSPHGICDVATDGIEALKAFRLAWQEGARLDGWSDHFSFPRWQSALARSGLEPSFYLHRTRPWKEILPWSLVRFAAGPAYLWRERERAWSDPQPTNERKG